MIPIRTVLGRKLATLPKLLKWIEYFWLAYFLHIGDLHINQKRAFQRFKWVCTRNLKWSLLVARATERKITCLKELPIWPWNLVHWAMICVSLESRYSQLSFGVLIVQIGWEKEKLHSFQNYMYIFAYIHLNKFWMTPNGSWEYRLSNDA